MSAVSSSEGPIRQADAYWQASDRKRETQRDEGEEGVRESVLKSLTLARAAMSADPGGHHSPAPSEVLFKAKQISGTECHRKDTQASSPPISVQGFKSPFLLPRPTDPSSSFLHPASHPHSTPDYHIEGRHRATDLRSPVSGWARFIDISCQLSFWEIAHRINFNYVLMLNILETLNFMVGDAHSSMSIYQVLGALLKDPFFFLDSNLIRSSS